MNKGDEHKWSHFSPTHFRSFLFLATSVSPAVPKGEVIGGGHTKCRKGEVFQETKESTGAGGKLVLVLFIHIQTLTLLLPSLP